MKKSLENFNCTFGLTLSRYAFIISITILIIRPLQAGIHPKSQKEKLLQNNAKSRSLHVHIIDISIYRDSNDMININHQGTNILVVVQGQVQNSLGSGLTLTYDFGFVFNEFSTFQIIFGSSLTGL